MRNRRHSIRRHAEFFCAVADRAYVEWDTAPAPDWLARLRPELDNFRAALKWALDEKNDVEFGALLAASLCPMFMRLSLLHEGIEWCRSRARTPAVRSCAGRSATVLRSLDA